jgi:hypothetical protein
MTRALPAVVAACAILFGSADRQAVAANGSWTTPQAQSASIGSTPWIPAAKSSAAFGPEDALVFADVVPSSAPDADAIALATRGDEQRLTAGPDQFVFAAPKNRVSAAFAGFVAVGAEGLAYASAEFAGEVAVATRHAPAAIPSLMAMLPQFR